jgi:hypothetical protein
MPSTSTLAGGAGAAGATGAVGGAAGAAGAGGGGTANANFDVVAAAAAAAAAAVAAFAVNPLVNKWFVPHPSTNTVTIDDMWILTDLASLNPLVSKCKQSLNLFSNLQSYLPLSLLFYRPMMMMSLHLDWLRRKPLLVF